MRDTIFISHATPEDNDFTIWLASRLELLGFKVWIDKKELLGGETFWDEIEFVIRESAIKFLLVYSENILDRSQQGKIRNGVQKEIDFAKRVIADNSDLKDFFIILNLDNSPYDLFAGSGDLNQIAFNQDWAEGLSFLIKKFQKDSVPYNTNKSLTESSEWYLDNYIVKNPIVEKKELYYTNWWTADYFPEYFYILRFESEQQALAIQECNADKLVVASSNCLVAFTKDLDLELTDNFGINKITPTDIFDIKVAELIVGYEKETFPTHRDAENHFKKLFKRALHHFFRDKQMKWYDMANRNVAYYHTPSSLPTSKVAFQYPYQTNNRPKKKQLFGKYLTIGKWHFAISVKPVLIPYVGFHIKSHIVFTTNGFKPIEEKNLQHSFRRKKGKRMFNEEWRDLLIGFINSLKGESGRIEIKTGAESPIMLKNNVEMFWSDYGYYDPRDLERQSLLNQDDLEELDEEME